MDQVTSEVLAAGLQEYERSKLPPLRWPSQAMGESRIDIGAKAALWLYLDREQFENGAS